MLLQKKEKNEKTKSIKIKVADGVMYAAVVTTTTTMKRKNNQKNIQQQRQYIHCFFHHLSQKILVRHTPHNNNFVVGIMVSILTSLCIVCSVRILHFVFLLLFFLVWFGFLFQFSSFSGHLKEEKNMKMMATMTLIQQIHSASGGG